VSRRNAFYRVPDSTSSDAAIAFGCAMPTALHGMQRLTGVAGANVVIQGAGPVGLAACVLCSIGGARSITVIGDPPQRLEFARRFGANHTIGVANTTMQERSDRIMALTGGRGGDVVVEAAGRIEAFPEGLDLVANHGRYLIMGLYSGTTTTPLNPVRINNRNLSILGSLGNAPSVYKEAVDIATEHGRRLDFEALVTHRFPLEQTETAINCARQGESIKAVVTPNAA
jgi:5-exo-hydroxycamphor dehydrogenase